MKNFTPNTIGYTYHSNFNRASEERKEQANITNWLNNAQCKLFICHQGFPWLIKRENGTYAAGFKIAVNYTIPTNSLLIFLGIADGGIPIFALELDSAEVFAQCTNNGEAFNVRKVAGLLSEEEANLLMYAQGILYWHSKNGYCSNCGSPNQVEEAGHLLACTNAECKRLTYPSIHPAVIVLIESINEQRMPVCLLARHRRYSPESMMSTLAGFVEVGETLEQTVKREVLEEAGIIIEDVRYIASQPWPFPSSLMLGFRATTASMKIVLDENELSAARWFTASQLRESMATGEVLPSRPDSIARYLIMDWLNEQVSDKTKEGRYID